MRLNLTCRNRWRAGLAALALVAGPAGAAQEARVERLAGVMGTTLRLEVEAADRATALAASEAALRAVEAAERRLSTWTGDSELAAFNRAPAGVEQPLSPELRADLAAALQWWEASGGAFDPAVGPLVRLWDLRGAGRVPDRAEIEQVLAACSARQLRLTAGGAVRLHPDLCLEEGGFGKGRALDLALEAARRRGASAALLDLGGQLAVLGGGPLRVEVADPQDRSRPVARFPIDHGSVATSGNGVRGRRAAGQAIGHLLDPRSGCPAPDFGSLTVWAEDATAADCLSTGLYVLGPDAALEWAAAHPGVEVLVLEFQPPAPPAPGRLRARASAGLAARLEALVPGLSAGTPPHPASNPAHE